jgi:hypothetical protein
MKILVYLGKQGRVRLSLKKELKRLIMKVLNKMICKIFYSHLSGTPSSVTVEKTLLTILLILDPEKNHFNN